MTGTAPLTAPGRLVVSPTRGRHGVVGPVVLAASMTRCPVMRWVFENPGAREKVCLAYARTVFAGATRAVVHTTVGRCRGVAVWSSRIAWKGTAGGLLTGDHDQEKGQGFGDGLAVWSEDARWAPGHGQSGVDGGRGGSGPADDEADAPMEAAVVRVGVQRWRSWQLAQALLSSHTGGVDLRHLAVVAADPDPDAVVAALLGVVLRRADAGGARLGTVATSPEECALLVSRAGYSLKI